MPAECCMLLGHARRNSRRLSRILVVALARLMALHASCYAIARTARPLLRTAACVLARPSSSLRT